MCFGNFDDLWKKWLIADRILNLFLERLVVDIAAKEVFSEHFSLDLVTKNSKDPATINTQLEELVKELQKTINGDMDKLLLLLSLNR